MRAWLLLLAVLATFQPIVQVASTEDNISSRFITAIAPRSKTIISSASTTQQETITALAAAFNTVTDLSPSTPGAAPSSASSDATFLYENSDSDNLAISKEIDNSNNLIIEIKNIGASEGGDKRVNEKVSQKLTNQRTENTIDKLDNSKKSMQLSSSEMVRNQNKEIQLHIVTDETPAGVSADGMALRTDESATSSAENTESASRARQPQRQHKDQRSAHHSHSHHQHPHTQHTHSPASFTSSSSSLSAFPASQAPDVSDTAPAVDASEAIDQSSSHPSSAIADDEDQEPATYSNKEIISEKVKPDPSTLVEIENSLLSLFNMKRPPKIDRSKIIIPEAMKQLYAQIMGHELDSVNIPKPGLLAKSANTVRSFTHIDSKIDDRFPHHHRFRLHFDIKSIPAKEKLKAAELQLTRDAISHTALNPRQANRTRYQVLVYDITRVGVRGKREPSYLLLDNKTVRLNSTETLSLDVQPAIDRWLATPKKNFGLLVEVRTMRTLRPAPHHHVRLRRSADEPLDSWQRKQPLLFTYTDDGRYKSRSIRDVSTRSKRAENKRKKQRRKNHDEICRRHSLYVDFSDVGWSDWIVAPPGYDAFYCHGKCPFPLAEHLNSTNHAVVQTLVNNLNPGKVPKACCVPTQLEGISMLYLNDQSTVVLKNYQDMTVVGCGCQ